MAAAKTNKTVTAKTKEDPEILFLRKENYSTVEKYKEGCFGSILTAIDNATNRNMAIKIVPRKNIDAEWKYTISEILVLSKIRHENIIKINNVMMNGSKKKMPKIFIVMDLMEGNLHSLVYNVALTDEDHKNILYQIFSGLNHIHAANLVHCDIKPENIFYAESLRIKIGDFGSVRIINSTVSDFHTPLTRDYTAPEVLINKSRYSPARDIWAVGCVLAFMFNRNCLFYSQNFISELKKIEKVVPSVTQTALDKIKDKDSIYYNFMKLCLESPTKKKLWHSIFCKHIKDCPTGMHMLESLLQFDPSKRLTAAQALRHDYIKTSGDPNEDQLPIHQFTAEDDQFLNYVDITKDVAWECITRAHSKNLD